MEKDKIKNGQKIDMPNKNHAIVAKATKNLKNKLRLTAFRNNSFFSWLYYISILYIF